MIILKTKDQIMKMKAAGEILAEVHHRLRDLVKPGVSTMELNDWVDNYIVSKGAYPEQKGYQGFPYAICASVNDEICHGFPDSKCILKDGDIISIDMVVNYKGWLADSAWTYKVGKISEEKEKLMNITREAMYRGIEKAIIGNRLGDIGHAIQSFVEENNYNVVREFIGHGIGKNMHEDPQVLHYGKENTGIRISKGMVFTVEPMIVNGDFAIKMDSNGWTARTKDKSMCAQYEHTLAITEDGPFLITDQGDV